MTTYRVYRFDRTVSVQVVSTSGRHLSIRTFYSARAAAAWLCAHAPDEAITYVLLRQRPDGTLFCPVHGEQEKTR